ncbi:MAG: MBL fold metallo-hydrolase [Acidimicrobiia bacterium]|nr:MBL fold metallo-hydrolase [Acidimicrobiia bacterium]
MSGPVVEHHGPGISRIEVPLPFERLRSVNAYIIEGDGGLTLIDCGTATIQGFDALHDGLARLGHSLHDIRRVVGTHLHVDHMALAGQLVHEIGCDFVMHRAASARLAEYNDWTITQAHLATLAARHGASPEEVAKLSEPEPRPDWAATGIEPTHPVDDDREIALDSARSLKVVYTPGHDIAHICLLDSKTGLLFSGDHVLPRITPVVLVSLNGTDTLAQYMSSLRRVMDLDVHTTLPAHGDTIPRGSDRARQILLHHRRRLDEIIDLTASRPMSGWALMQALFRPHMDVFHQRLAFGETMAHAEHLAATGRLMPSDPDGVVVFRAAPGHR